MSVCDHLTASGEIGPQHWPAPSICNVGVDSVVAFPRRIYSRKQGMFNTPVCRRGRKTRSGKGHIHSWRHPMERLCSFGLQSTSRCAEHAQGPQLARRHARRSRGRSLWRMEFRGGVPGIARGIRSLATRRCPVCGLRQSRVSQCLVARLAGSSAWRSRGAFS